MKASFLFEREELSDEEKFNEYILTSLRTIWGISLRKLFLEFGEKSAMEFQLWNIIPLLDDEQIELQGKILYLPEEGKFFADRIASDLFVSLIRWTFTFILFFGNEK